MVSTIPHKGTSIEDSGQLASYGVHIREPLDDSGHLASYGVHSTHKDSGQIADYGVLYKYTCGNH
jgi:hypothetical protein